MDLTLRNIKKKKKKYHHIILMIKMKLELGMAILHRPTPNLPAPHGFYPPRRGGEAGMGQDFCRNHRGGAVMGIGTTPPRLARPAPTFNNITKILVLIIM
jgi:hypothetical protein